MEFDRLRLYSGPGRNLAALLQSARLEKAAMPPGAALPMGVASARWRPLGPDRVNSNERFTAGRVSAIAIHPTDMNILYAGGAQGGVWRSDDAGANWRPLTDRECSLAMGSIAIDPVDPDIVYAGTGEQHFSADSYYGCGVLRSLDAGETWEQLGVRAFLGRRSEDSGGARIARVVIDRASAGSTSSATVLAASTYGLFRSTDSGMTWDLVLEGTATDLVPDPRNASVLYAAVYGRGVYKSTDTGASWTRASTGMNTGIARRINLAIAPSAPRTLYASFQTNESKGSGLTMYRTVNGAATWQQLPASGASCFYQCWYDMTIAVHPSNPRTVYFGSVRLYRSLDGGQSFATHHNGIYIDQHLLVFDTLRGANALYLANDGGVYRTTDGGTSWTSLATNLAVAQYYGGISLHPSIAGTTLGGTQDQGTQRSSAGTTTWEKVMGGDGGYTAFDVENPATWYAETQWMPNAEYIGPRKNGRLAVNGIDRGERGLFIPPLVMDPMDSKRLYFGVQSLYRTDNAADSWERIHTLEGGVVTSIGLTPSDPNTVYAGVLWGRVIVTRDGGATWHASGSGLPDRFIGDVAVHPDDPEQAYAVAGGFLTGHVFHTVDGGLTWEDRTGNLPDHPVNAILYDPADLEGVFIGTDLGVFYSATGGGTWDRLDDALPTVAVFDLAAQPGTSRLVAATHGRGMFEIPVEVPLTLRVRPSAIVDTIGVVTEMAGGGEVIVAPSGREDYATSWEATTAAPWLGLTAAAGRGRGRFQYEISGARLEPGRHETTIGVTLAGMADPLEIPVSLWVEPPLTVPPLRQTSGSGVSTWSVISRDSLPAGLYGSGADTAVWNATSRGSEWLVIEQATGGSEESVVWTRSSRSLAPGVYEDTITIGVVGRSDLSGIVVDRFEVVGPMSVEDVVLHYLDLERLTAEQVRLLMRFGNGNDRFDLGDVLRWFDHCNSQDVSATGCPSASATLPRARQSIGQANQSMPTNRSKGR